MHGPPLFQKNVGFDVNGTGLLSLAEIDKAVQARLQSPLSVHTPLSTQRVPLSTLRVPLTILRVHEKGTARVPRTSILVMVLVLQYTRTEYR